MRIKQSFGLATGLLLAGAAQAQAPATDAGFNPAISLILDGRFTDYRLDPGAYALPGFMLGGEAGLDDEGFALGHNELVMSANIDDLFYGFLAANLADHEGSTEVELEEAYIQTLGLSRGLTVKAGRFYSGLGYLNQQHPHAWDFADAPLAYRALFGNQLRDDGVQLSWVAPTPVYLQLGAEWLRGENFPAAGAANEGKGAHTLFAKLGGDVGVSHAWQLGLARWSADVEDRRAGAHAHEEDGPAEVPSFTGDSSVTALDLVWKWAPQGNPSQRNFKFQAEYFVRDEDGEVSLIGADPAEVSTYDGTQKGWYAQAVYQFMPRWRVGARYDRLQADNRGSDPDVLEEAGLDDADHRPQRYSAMVDFSRTEFSRLRLQYNRDESRPEADDQWIVQYVMSLGAHGAHRF